MTLAHRLQRWTNNTPSLETSPVGLTYVYSAYNRRLTNVGLMLAHRLRRWPNIKPALAQRLGLAGYTHLYCLHYSPGTRLLCVIHESAL